MFGCFFRLVRFVVVLGIFAAIGGGVYYYTRVHPERAPWKDGAAAVRDKVTTASLAAQVKGALSLRESLHNLGVEVSAERDVVTLRGRVRSEDLSKGAEDVAASVPGVRQVVNFLEVDAAAGPSPGTSGSDDRSIGERVDDEALELKIRAAFKLDRQLADAGFDVKAMRKVIRLSSSTASAEQKQRAMAVAKTIDGVASVESAGPGN